MFVSILRFWLLGWIEKLYLQPSFHFSYYGLSFIRPVGDFTYVIFAVCALSSLLLAAGYKYRFSAVVFFFSFTYIEAMDKTTYLNHYYLISILALILIFLPAHKRFSIDAWRNQWKFTHVPAWTIDVLKLTLAVVYIYAGLAKINSEWLHGLPLRIWLPSKASLPLLGSWLTQDWFIYTMAYAGMLYDLAIPFLLWYKRTRAVAFVLVIGFHLMTRWLFPIGMFPYVMIFSALIFFSGAWHERMMLFLRRCFGREGIAQARVEYSLSRKRTSLIPIAIILLLHLLLPWRYLLYPGELFWTEEGYRFSWRVMLMEKSGYAQFKVVEKPTGKTFYIDNSKYLTPFQEKQMAFQPDFILEYAHYLQSVYGQSSDGKISIYVDNLVSLNGRKSKTLVRPDVDLTQIEESLSHKKWLAPLDENITGL